MSEFVRGFLSSPLPFAVILAVLGFLLLHKQLRVALCLWAMALLMLLQSSAWIFEWGAQPLIERAQQLSLNTDCLDMAPVVVVLGGGLSGRDQLSASSRERVSKAADFLREKPKTVVFSGGPTLKNEAATEAELSERELRSELGATADKLIIWREEQSLSTHKNATNTRRLLDERGMRRHIVLITSVFHMRRAAATFSKEGFDVCALPAYPPTLKPPQALSYSNTLWIAGLVHEYLGYWYYQWRGWI
jgi:uncharacterized SAM-binding protein YcdF (DUF218 family)